MPENHKAAGIATVHTEGGWKNFWHRESLNYLLWKSGRDEYFQGGFQYPCLASTVEGKDSDCGQCLSYKNWAHCVGVVLACLNEQAD